MKESRTLSADRAWCRRRRKPAPLQAASLVAILACFSWSCSVEPPLPESYGVYAREGGRLVRLTGGVKSADIESFGEDVELVVFERVLGSPLITDPSAHMHLIERSRVRYSVVRTLSRDDKLVDFKIAKANDWALLSSGVRKYEVVPASERNDLLVLRPSSQLMPGEYSLRLSFEDAVEYRFRVDGGMFADSTPPCFDHYFNTRGTSGRFSWDEFLEIAAAGIDGQRSIDGKRVVSDVFQACSATDELLATWQQGIQSQPSASTLDDLQWMQAVALVRGLEDGDLSERLASSLRRDAEEALSEGRWNDAVRIAARGLELRANGSEFEELIDTAEERREAETLAEQEAAARRFESAIRPLLGSGGWFFGEAATEGGGVFPFRFRVTHYDESSGSLQGEMDYYPVVDRARISIQGRVEPTRLVFEHVDVLRAGLSQPNFRYALALNGERRLGGSFESKRRRGSSGTVRISLEEARRLEEIAAQADAQAARIAEAKTPTREILTVRTLAETHILTDVSIASTHRLGRSTETFYFTDIVGTPVEERGFLHSSVRFQLAGGKRESLNEFGREDAQRMLGALIRALEVWRSKYPDLVPE